MNGEVIIQLQKGLQMKLYADSLLSKWIYCGEFERNEIRFLKRFLKKGDIFIDIGANIGFFTLFAAGAVGNSGKVYSFEPSQNTFKRLVDNVKLNELHNVFCFKLAASDKAARLPMKRPLGGFDAWSSLVSPTAGAEFVVEEVDCLSLDQFIGDNSLMGRVAMIKIDVEGWESRVLAGARQVLSRDDAPLLQVEFTDQACLAAGTTPKFLYDLLVSLGYDLFVYEPKLDVLIPDPLRDSYPCVNLIAAKPHSLNRVGKL